MTLIQKNRTAGRVANQCLNRVRLRVHSAMIPGEHPCQRVIVARNNADIRAGPQMPFRRRARACHVNIRAASMVNVAEVRPDQIDVPARNNPSFESVVIKCKRGRDANIGWTRRRHVNDNILARLRNLDAVRALKPPERIDAVDDAIGHARRKNRRRFIFAKQWQRLEVRGHR